MRGPLVERKCHSGSKPTVPVKHVNATLVDSALSTSSSDATAAFEGIAAQVGIGKAGSTRSTGSGPIARGHVRSESAQRIAA
jgi:hypothetical protein